MPAWVPPVGGAPLDLGGDPGNPRLDLGAWELHNDRVGTLAVRTAGATVQIRGAVGTTGTLAARTRGAYAVIAGVYDPNLLSDVVGQSRVAWTGAALGTHAAAAVFSAAPSSAVRGGGGAVSGWRPAIARPAPGLDRWRDSTRVASRAGAASWIEALLEPMGQVPAWKDSPGLRQGGPATWRHGTRESASIVQAWIGLPLLTHAHREPWSEGRRRDSARSDRWTDGLRLESVFIERWRDAAWLAYVWRNAPPVRPPAPWVSPWDARLCLGSGPYPVRSARLDLGHYCRGSLRLPSRRSYTMLHRSSLTRLSDGLAVPHLDWGLSIDADAWAWSWSATLLGTEALAAVLPSSAAEPVVLVAEIDGYQWHLIAEDWSEDLRHGSRSVKVTGRGLSAELGTPYELPATGTLQQARTVQQAVAERLPFGSDWTLVWWDGSARRPFGPVREPTPDWLLPAGSWTWQGQAPMQAIHEALQSVGLVLCPSPTGRVLTVQPRYPVAPWDYAAAEPDLGIPLSAITQVGRGLAVPAQANAVYVHGGSVGGLLSRVLRAGSAGDRTAQTQSSPWITHADAARLLGTRLLAAQERQGAVRRATLPLGGPDFPLVRVGDLVELELDTGPVRDIVSGTAVAVTRTSVRQTLSLGEETANTWARWRRLLPEPPLLVATVSVAHADGTSTVAYPGAGTQRVRGSAAVGTRVWVRGGVIEGEAPEMEAVEIEV
jgi:hypothetical protein